MRFLLPIRVKGWYADRLSDYLPELAHHYSRSANTGKAVEYLRMAGGDALQRSAYREAVRHLRQGLKLLEAQSEGTPRDQQELVMRVSLAWATGSGQGFNAPEVESSLLRARELCSAAEARHAAQRAENHTKAI
jgi:predicted ATPase